MPDNWDSCQPFQPGPAECRVAPRLAPQNVHPAFLHAAETYDTGLNCEDFRAGKPNQEDHALACIQEVKDHFPRSQYALELGKRGALARVSDRRRPRISLRR